MEETAHSETPGAKKYVPGGSLQDFFYEVAPKWSVRTALNRLLTKVKHDPANMVSIQKFVKDSCKGYMKEFFQTIRDSMENSENVVMAEIAYRSFLQLAAGDEPLVIIHPPKTKPRTKAAAVSDEGYAFKDYYVQVTQKGFDLMGSSGGSKSGQSPPSKQRKLDGGMSMPVPPNSTGFGTGFLGASNGVPGMPYHMLMHQMQMKDPQLLQIQQHLLQQHFQHVQHQQHQQQQQQQQIMQPPIFQQAPMISPPMLFPQHIPHAQVQQHQQQLQLQQKQQQLLMQQHIQPQPQYSNQQQHQQDQQLQHQTAISHQEEELHRQQQFHQQQLWHQQQQMQLQQQAMPPQPTQPPQPLQTQPQQLPQKQQQQQQQQQQQPLVPPQLPLAQNGEPGAEAGGVVANQDVEEASVDFILDYELEIDLDSSAKLLEQGAEAANSFLAYAKATVDSYLAAIYHIRTDNERLRRENYAIELVNHQLQWSLQSCNPQNAFGATAANTILPNSSVPELTKEQVLVLQAQALERAKANAIGGPTSFS